MKAAQHNRVVVSCVLMRIREEKSTGIKTLEVFHNPNLYIFHIARHFTAGRSVQACVRYMIYRGKIRIILVGTYVF